MTSDLYMRYLGALGVLSRASVYVPEEIRECIEQVFEDACKHHPLKWQRVLDRIEIAPDTASPVKSDNTTQTMYNYAPYGFGEHTIKITIQRWDFRGHIWVKVGGDCRGISVMSDIADTIWELALCNPSEIKSDCNFKIDDDFWYTAVLKNKQGDTLNDCSDQQGFEDAIVGIEIVDYKPKK